MWNMTGEKPLKFSKRISHWVSFELEVFARKLRLGQADNPGRRVCRKKEDRMTSRSVSSSSRRGRREERSLSRRWRAVAGAAAAAAGANKEGWCRVPRAAAAQCFGWKEATPDPSESTPGLSSAGGFPSGQRKGCVVGFQCFGPRRLPHAPEKEDSFQLLPRCNRLQRSVPEWRFSSVLNRRPRRAEASVREAAESDPRETAQWIGLEPPVCTAANQSLVRAPPYVTPPQSSGLTRPTCLSLAVHARTHTWRSDFGGTTSESLETRKAEQGGAQTLVQVFSQRAPITYQSANGLSVVSNSDLSSSSNFL